MLADDLGWTDAGCFRSSYYQTPNIDRLRGQGMKFTAAYTCGPNCAPTRACLMSGLYLPFYAVHSPIMAPETTIARYRGRPPAGGHKNAAYAAMLDNMDAGIGRVLERLDALKLTDRTLVIFISDNGGVGGYRAAGVAGGGDTTSNAPLRGGKGMLYEGGVRVPMVVRWLGVVKPGSTGETPAISVDFFPTLAGIAGARTPERHDGVSFAPLLRDPRARLGRDTLYWHFPGYLEAGNAPGVWRTTPAGAIRSGDWKLIEFFEDGRMELYNVKEDIGESRDLAEANPAKREELHAKLLAWRKAVNAPMPRRKPAGS